MLRALHPVSDDPPVLVSDLIEGPMRRWNRAAMTTHMNPIDADALFNIPISTSTSSDWWAWHYERTGVFSVRSAYRLLVGTKRRREDWLENRGNNSDTRASQNQWVNQWKTRVPGNVKNFAWRLAKN